MDSLDSEAEKITAPYCEVKPRADFVFEVSWEICNKVGGIYTVISSKVGPMMNCYGSHYFAVGPFFPKNLRGVFEEKAPPEDLKNIFGRLEKEGIKCYFGKWLIEGEPNTILVDFSSFSYKTNEIKKELWEKFQVDSLGTVFYDFDEPVVWAYACGRLIEEFRNEKKDKIIVGQFHEWLSGSGLLYLKERCIPVATVFTTHATMLGRSISGTGVNMYEIWDQIDPDAKARELGVQAKHLMEKACAKNADCFTTVSETTGNEAEHLLKKKPDIILPNGLDMNKFPTFEEASIKHKLYRERMKEFLLYFFFPYQSFDLDQTLFYFLCSRYEFHGKGIDIFIESLGKLNEKLKAENSQKTVVAFIWVPGNVKGIKPEILENRSFFEDIKDDVDDRSVEIKNRIISLIVSKSEISEKNLFDEEFILRNKTKVLRLMRKSSPPLTTHDLYDEQNDCIMKAFISAGLTNQSYDRVKVIFYPIYLSGADSLLDLSYYEAIQGSHLGIFPSYYEPWGYTPLEAAALGVPAVTSDLSGFGRYIAEKGQRSKYKGIYILNRLGKTNSEEVSDLTKILYDYSQFSKAERTRNKIEAKRLSLLVDWQRLIKFYIEAHNFAIKKRF